MVLFFRWSFSLIFHDIENLKPGVSNNILSESLLTLSE
ncbi:hypothetical protein M132_1511 [Bacteroides fragilis str. S24L15]|nr:hypothetical protein M086_1468 [Bacteroides fragilis str. S13 L11]EYA19838.1 hypothetical protein M146_2022 [Bacteroides fragilis str. 1007-1-F \